MITPIALVVSITPGLIFNKSWVIISFAFSSDFSHTLVLAFLAIVSWHPARTSEPVKAARLGADKRALQVCQAGGRQRDLGRLQFKAEVTYLPGGGQTEAERIAPTGHEPKCPRQQTTDVILFLAVVVVVVLVVGVE